MVVLVMVQLLEEDSLTPSQLLLLAFVLVTVQLDEKPATTPTVVLHTFWFSTMTSVQLARITCPAPSGTVPPSLFFQ